MIVNCHLIDGAAFQAEFAPGRGVSLAPGRTGILKVAGQGVGRVVAGGLPAYFQLPAKQKHAQRQARLGQNLAQQHISGRL